MTSRSRTELGSEAELGPRFVQPEPQLGSSQHASCTRQPLFCERRAVSHAQYANGRFLSLPPQRHEVDSFPQFAWWKGFLPSEVEYRSELEEEDTPEKLSVGLSG